MKITRLDHVAIAVDDIEAALPFFTEVLGLEVTQTDVEEAQGVVVAFMPLGDTEIELIEPVDSESGVARYLARRGPGMHHLCLEVDDMDAALAHLRAHSVRLIDDEPYVGTGGRRIVFIHPKAAHGMLVELYEKLPGDRDANRLARFLGNEDLRLRLAELQQSLSERSAELAERRRRLVERGRMAAAGTRGFIEGLRRGNGDDVAPAVDDLESDTNAP